MASQVAVIKTLVKALTQVTSQTGANAVNMAMVAIGLPGYTSLLNTFNQAYSSAITTQNFLSQYCGINLNNSDTGAITGSDAGSSKTKTAESIIPESTSEKELTEAEYSSFTKKGLTVNVIYNNNDLTKQRLIVKKLYNWWIPEALDLIDESLGVNFYDGRASTNTINFVFNNYSSAFLSCNMNFNSQGRPSDITVNINTNYLNVTENDKNGNIVSSTSEVETSLNGTSFYYYNDGTNYFDSFLANNLAAATLMSNINYYYLLPQPIYFGLVNVVDGMDNTIYKALSDYGSENINLYDVDMGCYGYAFMRYLTKAYANQFNDEEHVLINGDSSDEIVMNNAKYVTINGGNGKDSIGNFNDNVLINGEAGNDMIINNHCYNTSIFGGNGNDSIQNHGENAIISAGTGEDYILNMANKITINANEGNDTILNEGNTITITGGAGNDLVTLTSYHSSDLIKYADGDGNDTIMGYDSSDTIHITSGNYTTITSGQDVKISVGSGSILLENAKNKNLNIKGTYIGSSTSTTGGGTSTSTSTSTTLTITNSTKSPVTVDSAIKTINASTRTTAVKIIGNSLANTIYGGKGNDTLTGGSGADVFVYSSGGGKDVITDYTAGQDKIKITGAKISKSSVSGNDVILTVGSGSINVKNGKGKKLSLYNNATSLTNTVIGSSSTSTSSGSTSTTTSTTLTVTNSTKSPVTASSKIKTINASTRTTAVKITGNTLANSIVGGKGADTLTGGKGNDTLKGGSGSDVFIYKSGDGNDVITDYTASDKISITGGTYTRLTVGNDVKIKVGSGSILLKNSKNKSVTINNSKSFEEHWFMEGDNNFTTSEINNIINDNKNISADYSLKKSKLNFIQDNEIIALTDNQSAHSSYSEKK